MVGQEADHEQTRTPRNKAKTGGPGTPARDLPDVTLADDRMHAPVAHALGIPLDRVHKSNRGRPMKLAGGGTPIEELIA